MVHTLQVKLKANFTHPLLVKYCRVLPKTQLNGNGLMNEYRLASGSTKDTQTKAVTANGINTKATEISL